MLAVDYSTVKDNLKVFCDKAALEDETILVTREPMENIILMSAGNYEQLMKSIRNAEYLTMIDQGIEQLSAGLGQEHELIECEA